MVNTFLIELRTYFSNAIFESNPKNCFWSQSRSERVSLSVKLHPKPKNNVWLILLAILSVVADSSSRCKFVSRERNTQSAFVQNITIPIWNKTPARRQEKRRDARKKLNLRFTRMYNFLRISSFARETIFRSSSRFSFLFRILSWCPFLFFFVLYRYTFLLFGSFHKTPYTRCKSIPLFDVPAPAGLDSEPSLAGRTLWKVSLTVKFRV